MISLPKLHYPECYALVSGGKDSLSAAQVMYEHGLLKGCVALETGISTPDWKDFIIKTCKERGWPLEFFSTNANYDDLVRKYGFPGPSKHSWFMSYLKGRAIRQFKKAHPHDPLCSGVRKAESQRRKIHTKPISIWEGVPILAPIYDWTTEETWAFFYKNGFERAPGYSTLQISGDCLCGAFAREEELDAINFHYPEIGKRFCGLQDEIKDKFPKRCQWGWAGRLHLPVCKPANVSAVCVECGDTLKEEE